MRDRLRELQEHQESLSVTSSTWYDEPDRNRLIVASYKSDDKHKVISRMVRRNVNMMLNLKKQQNNDPKHFESSVKNLQDKLSVIQNHIKDVQYSTKKLKELHTKALMALKVSTDEEAEMGKLIANGRAAAKLASSHLAELDHMDIDGAPEIQSKLTHIRQNQVSYVRLCFMTAMEQFERELDRYARGLRQIVSKQIAIVSGDTDPAHTQDCIDTGRILAFVDNYQLEEQQAKDMLEAVSQRQTELEALEKSITEVRDLFADVAVLIAMQGAVVDNIEMLVERAAAEATKGNKQLKSAGKKQRSARKKKIILGAIGSAVAVGLITLVAI